VQVVNALVILGAIGVAMIAWEHDQGASFVAGLIATVALIDFTGLAARQAWAVWLGLAFYGLPAAGFGLLALSTMGRGGSEAGCIGVAAMVAMALCAAPAWLLAASRKEI